MIPNFVAARNLRSTLLACGLMVAALCVSTKANLVIVPTFDISITSDPNAAAIEAGINLAITQLESYISNPVTVRIEFKSITTGLAESLSAYNRLPYTAYLGDIVS